MTRRGAPTVATRPELVDSLDDLLTPLEEAGYRLDHGFVAVAYLRPSADVATENRRRLERTAAESGVDCDDVLEHLTWQHRLHLGIERGGKR